MKNLILSLLLSTALFAHASDEPPILKPNLDNQELIPNEGSLGGEFTLRQGLGEVEIVKSDFKGKNALSFTPKAFEKEEAIHLPCAYIRNLPENFPQGVTFQAWVKPDSLWMASSSDILSARVSDRGTGMALCYYPATGIVTVVSGSGGRDGEIWGIGIQNNIKIQPDEWTHLAAVYDAEARQFRLYLNGQFAGESETGLELTPMNRTLTIGAYRSGSTYPFRGEITDIAVYDYVRTEEQIRADAEEK